MSSGSRASRSSASRGAASSRAGWPGSRRIGGARSCRSTPVTPTPVTCGRAREGAPAGAGSSSRATIDEGAAMAERDVRIETGDGAMTTFVAHPDEGGPFPLVLLYMDALGLRDELRGLGRRVAAAGYYAV